jgi:hypothetical protein
MQPEKAIALFTCADAAEVEEEEEELLCVVVVVEPSCAT